MERREIVLSVGLTVKIKRSNGRVHDAQVTGVDSSKSLVSVEWNEAGEIKGKEMELAQILHLNPDILAKPITPKPFQSKLVAPRRQTTISPKVHSGIPRPQAPSRLKNVENIMNSKSSATLHPLHTVLEDPMKRNPVSRSKSAGSLSGNGKNGGKSVSNISVRHQPVAQQPTVVAPPTVKEKKEKDISKDKPAGPGGSRKSTVVKEVDNIKKKRDERRVKNAELKQKKREDFDPDNPNWEFLSMIRDFRQGVNIRPLVSCDPVTNDRICVCVRKRPLSKKEVLKKEIDIITIPDGSLTMVHEPRAKVDLTKFLEHHKFRFDYAFDESATNDLIYHYSAKRLVDTIFDQGMATCFAYGQTGSGKTHTMGGNFNGKEQDPTKGIYALAAADVFRLNRVTHGSKNLSVSASFFEIYCSKVFDLLNGKKKLRTLENAQQKVQIVGLQEEGVSSVSDVLQLIETGNRIRTSGTTSANQNSSRSHAIFQLILRKKGSNKLHGKLSLIDLAGNERGADTSSSDRQTRWEGAEINKSLLALKECIRALGKKSAHLPFRGSTLTLVLRDSFIGPKAKTCMISTISPGLNCCEHTLNTLRYAERVKDLPGKGSGGTNEAQCVIQKEEEFGRQDDHETSLLPVEQELEDLEPEYDDLEKSSELQTFHEALLQLQEAEEKIFDEHKEIIQEYREAVTVESEMLSKVEAIDGSPEDYIQKLILMMDQRMIKLSLFKAHLQEYNEKLKEEEAASQLLKKVPPVL